MLNIAVLDDYGNISTQVADWSAMPKGTTVTTFTAPIPAGIAADTLQPFDIICTVRERMPLPGDLLRKLANLKLIVTVGTDIANLDTLAAAECGIKVMSTSLKPDEAELPALINTTPELAWGLLMATVRHIAKEHQHIREGGWQSTMGTVLAGRTLGLLGFGNIAKRMAHYARAFDMNVIAWSRSLTPELAQEHGASYVELDDLYRQSDILSIHLSLNNQTRGFVKAKQLALMKGSAYLINTARAPLIEEAALLEALWDRKIAGAGLDVFDIEPLPVDHPLRLLPNVTLTPHLGYASPEALALMFRSMPSVVEACLASGDLLEK